MHNAIDIGRIFPLNQTVKQSSKAKIFCFSIVHPSWIYNGKKINEFIGGFSWNKKYSFGIADNAFTLAVHNVRFTDVGEYECQGTNTLGNKFYARSKLYIKGNYRIHCYMLIQLAMNYMPCTNMSHEGVRILVFIGKLHLHKFQYHCHLIVVVFKQ